MKYYAVRVGRNPGIYTTWPECQDQVNGFSGAIFKSFTNKNDAEDFINGKTNVEAKPSIKEDPNRITAYVDGSYNQDTGYAGYGVYIKDGDKEHIFYDRFKLTAGGNNAEGEVAASLVAAKYAVENNKPITIYFDHLGIQNWVDGTWKRNTPYTIGYHNEMNNMIRNGLDVKFCHTKGHSGILGNEYVDRIAKYACNIFLSDADIRLLLQLKDATGFPAELDF